MKRSSSLRQSDDFKKTEKLESEEKEVNNQENKLQVENYNNSEWNIIISIIYKFNV